MVKTLDNGANIVSASDLLGSASKTAAENASNIDNLAKAAKSLDTILGVTGRFADAARNIKETVEILKPPQQQNQPVMYDGPVIREPAPQVSQEPTPAPAQLPDERPSIDPTALNALGDIDIDQLFPFLQSIVAHMVNVDPKLTVSDISGLVQAAELKINSGMHKLLMVAPDLTVSDIFVLMEQQPETVKHIMKAGM